MIAKTKLGLLGGLALAAAVSGLYVFAGRGDAPQPVPVDPLEEATPAAVVAAPEGHAPGGDCCPTGNDHAKGTHAQCPMKGSAPAPAVKSKASKCPYLAQVQAEKKGGPQ